MRKLSLALAVLLLLTLAGCGGNAGLLSGVTPSDVGEASDAAPLVSGFTVELFNAVYEGGEVECGGFTAYARAADGTLYYVHVDVNDDPETGALTESPLAIEPVAEEPGV